MNQGADRNEGAEAWRVPPGRYLRANPPRFGRRLAQSCYVEVRDGTQIAVDLHLPQQTAGGPPVPERLPVIAMFTPYYRRHRLKPGHRPDVEPSPNIAQFRDMFVPQGYALVVADVRGCGASFGSRDGFRSPRERLDYYDLADWIARQPWCDGAIGSTGISYVGAAADFLASTGHPAVKAVIPTFAVWDTWSNHLYPGGVLFNMLSKLYGDLAVALDTDRREDLKKYAYFADPDFDGPAPVDEDPDGVLLRQALYEHRGNFDMPDLVQQWRFRDDALTDDPDYTSARISPYHYADRQNDGRVAVYGVSGWMDGGGYTTGTIQRFLWQRNPAKRLLLGPWDHGARTNVSPWRRAPTPSFPLLAEYLRFFDEHLKGRETGLREERPIHYFTMAEEVWKAADAWPLPETRPTDFFLGEGGALAPEPPRTEGADRYRADYGVGTGRDTRYERLFAMAVETYYADWHGRDAKMLTYTTAALDRDAEVTGHPSIALHFACSERDCALFVYLEDVAPDGQCRYVTEGVFRALHRKPGDNPPAIPATGPTHSFNRADARHLVPGEPAEVAFELLPTSYLFRRGHRIRVAIAAADSDHFSRIPDGRPPLLTFFRSAQRPSRVTLPVIPR